MRAISLKAFFVSNVAGVVIWATGFIAIWSVGTVAELMVLGPDHFKDAAEAVFTSPGWGFCELAYFMVCCGVGGAIAAWMADERVLLNGALSSTLFVLLNVYLLIFGSPFHSSSGVTHHGLPVPKVLELAVSYAAPLYGVSGAYWAERTDWRIALRWFLAFVTTTITYLVGWFIAAKVKLSFGFVIASAVAILIGIAVAPREKRNQAFAALTAFLIAVPIVVLLWRLSDGRGSIGNFMWIFYNGMGAIFATIMDRRLTSGRH